MSTFRLLESQTEMPPNEHVQVIRIADRDASDADALQNLPPGVN